MAVSKLAPSHQEVNRRFQLLCKINNTESVKVSDLAKELSMKQTDLMQIVLDFPNIYTWRKGFKFGHAIITEIND